MPEHSLLITNGLVVSWEADQPLIEQGALYAEDGLIKWVGPVTDAPQRVEQVIDAKGQLIMPGLICAHTHFYGAYARGLAIPGPAPANFPQILERLWWPLDQALDAEAVRLSALVCLVDAIKHGTTTLIDHHASPDAIAGSLDWIAEAVTQAGLRAALCYEVTDRYGAESARAAITENVRFIRAAQGQAGLAGLFGLHASLTLSDETLADCVDATLGIDTGFHIHVAEHEADEEDSLRKSGKRVVGRLAAAGILGPRSIAAHAVHIDAEEAQILAETGTWVTHQPRSNMNNAVGAADIEGLLRQGVRVCLGNDGFSNAMWQEWKAAYLLHKVIHRDPRRANGMDIVQMAVHNNAALAGQLFPATPPGYLRPGAAADIILVDYRPYTPLTAGNLPWHILFGFEPSMVTTTVSAGRVLMRDRRLLTLDEAAIAAEAQALAPTIWERYNRIAAGM